MIVPDGYTSMWMYDSVYLFRCDRCGAIVDQFDITKHDNFHSLISNLVGAAV